MGQRRLFSAELAGALFVLAAGALAHFTYDWSGGNRLAAALTAVNESVWEHMKLLFVPMFLLTLFQLPTLGRRYPNFPAVRAVSALTGTALIPVLFYTYTGALGRDLLWADLAIFILAVAAAFVLERRLLARGRFSAPWQQAAGALALWAVLLLFVLFTFRPPHAPLWRDPITLGRGLGGTQT